MREQDRRIVTVGSPQHEVAIVTNRCDTPAVLDVFGISNDASML